jgi:hypothetical protein
MRAGYRKAHARNLAGNFARTGGVFYEIPDRPFPEAAIVQEARDQALATGLASFIELNNPAAISRVGQSIEIDAAGVKYRGNAFVLAAGIGSLALLDSIGQIHGITATSTPLVVVKSASPLKCGVYVDLETNLAFSVTRQPPTAKTRDGALVLAGATPKVLPIPWNGPREVPQARVNEVWSRVPRAALQECTRFTNLHRMGIEPYRDATPKEDPIVGAIAGCQNALFAFPGRATLASFVAEDVVNRLGIVGGRSATSLPLSNGWAGDVSMHFEDKYDNVDELV